MTDQNKNQNNTPPEYMGNIFGWKVSLIGLGVILLFILIMMVRYKYLENRGELKDVQDSVKIENPYREDY